MRIFQNHFNIWLKRIKSCRPNQWIHIYTLCAMLVAMKVNYNQHGWLNSDSLLYFEQARLMGIGEFKQAFALYQWPFYAALIAGLSKLTGITIHLSAQILNVGLFTLFAHGFYRLTLEAGGKNNTLHWANLLLLSTPYITGDILGMLLRDEGAWAGFTWALVYFIKFSKQATWANGLAFQAWMMISILFRIEVSAFLVILPGLVLLQNRTLIAEKILKLLKLTSCVCMVGCLVIAGLVSELISMQQLGRLQEISTQVTRAYTQSIAHISSKSVLLGQQVLGAYLDDYGQFCLWSCLILIVLAKTLKVAGLPTLLILAWPKRRWWNVLQAPIKPLSIAVLATGFIVSMVIIMNVFILSSRYVICSGIILLLLSAFAMSDLQKRLPTLATSCIVFMLVLSLLNNLWDKSHPNIHKLSVGYVSGINHQHSAVFYDTEQARFYAGQPYLNRIKGYKRFASVVEQQQIAAYGYYTITIGRDKTETEYEQLAAQVLTQNHYHLVHTLYGWRKKNKVLIYQRMS